MLAPPPPAPSPKKRRASLERTCPYSSHATYPELNKESGKPEKRSLCFLIRPSFEAQTGSPNSQKSDAGTSDATTFSRGRPKKDEDRPKPSEKGKWGGQRRDTQSQMRRLGRTSMSIIPKAKPFAFRVVENPLKT